jgi:hypothetical protein
MVVLQDDVKIRCSLSGLDFTAMTVYFKSDRRQIQKIHKDSKK